MPHPPRKIAGVNDNNKQNFDQSEKALQMRTSAFQQKLDKIDMSKEKKEVRNH